MKVYVDDNEDYRITYSSRDGSECLESMGMQPIIVESLADHDKQVRREVLEKLKIESPYCHMNCEVYYKVYPEILEKIIGETK